MSWRIVLLLAIASVECTPKTPNTMFPRPTYPDKVTPIIRPNPDWEEDLFQTVVVGPREVQRWREYRDVRKPRKARQCFCQAPKNTGAAPLLKLNDGRSVPGFGLGTWLGVSKKGGLEPVKDDSVERAVGWAIDAGYRHIDTASIYETEPQVGNAIKEKIKSGAVKREDLFVTTKLWNDRHLPDQVIPALQQSLSRLQLDYVDLYLIHWPIAQLSNGSYYDADYIETWKGMVEARDRGLARSIGVSNFNVKQLDRLLNTTSVKPAMLQVEVNLNLQQPELLAFCRQHGIAVTAYTPFGELTSRAGPRSPRPKIDDPKLVELAQKYNKTVPQIALRYLVELGVIPIPKSITKSRIEQNIDIYDFTLSPQERDLMKSFNNGYRTINPEQWVDSIYYPFEKTTK